MSLQFYCPLTNGLQKSEKRCFLISFQLLTQIKFQLKKYQLKFKIIMALKKTTAPEKIEPVDKGYTAPGYDVPKGEENSVTAMIEVITFDFGERTSKPRVYKTNIRQWDSFITNHRTGGWTILKILRLPESAQAFDPMEYYKDEPQIIKAIKSANV